MANLARSVSRRLSVLPALLCFGLSACSHSHAEEHGHGGGGEHHHATQVVVTSPFVKDVTVTQQYVCQIRSQQRIEVCALQDGYLESIMVKEGQAVQKGDVMFKILPTLYQARLSAERAEAQLAEIEFLNTKRLFDSTPPIVSKQEVALAQAKLDKAAARVKLAEAEVDFTVIRAPFSGLVDRLLKQQGSLIEKKDILTSLSDNSKMWVYFNVPEARYFEFQAHSARQSEPSRLELVDARIELILANGKRFPQDAGNTLTVEGEFNRETGNIPFRADFPNPTALLRHGQTGNVLIHQTHKHALVIPQRATFEILDKQYVFVIGEDHVVRQREIAVEHELDDIFVIKKGITAADKIVLEGVQLVRDGQKIEHPQFKKPEDALRHQKFPAE